MRDSHTDAHTFRKLRAQQVINGLSQLWLSAKLRLLTIVVCTIVIAGVVAAGAFEGFTLMRRQNLPGTGFIVGLLFDFMFLTLGVMLIFSGGLILYGSLFNSAETRFLLALPVQDEQVFAHKFFGAIGFSSWAFVLLGLPVLGSYGITYGVGLLFWLSLPLFLAGFLLIPGSIGALGCLAVVNLAPRRRGQLLVLVCALVVGIVAVAAYQFVKSAIHTDVTDRDAISGLLGQLGFARSVWVPSHWMTQGLQSAARGDFAGIAYPMALVWANGLLAFVVAAWASRHLLRRGVNRIQSGGGLRRQYGGLWIDNLVNRCLAFLDGPTRLLIVKDFRTFRRDPGQWAQVLIFAGLGVTYFANSRQFYRSDLGKPFQHGVSMVNLLATCLLLCAYMGRFIFPMLSLEGRKFWILGLMPLERRQLLLGKFAFAAIGAIIIAVPLVLVADVLLGLTGPTIVVHVITVTAVAAGLSSLAVGIGAILPNFRETDPSKIAVGFGGTMNLLVGLLFLIIEISLIAGPHQFRRMTSEDNSLAGITMLEIASMAIGIVGATIVTVLPLKIAVRALKRMEF